jgi:hypothetical protein
MKMGGEEEEREMEQLCWQEHVTHRAALNKNSTQPATFVCRYKTDTCYGRQDTSEFG